MKKLKKIFLFLAGAVATAVIVLLVYQTLPSKAAAPPGLRATTASSSTVNLKGPTIPYTLFAINTACTSRVITTLSSPAMINFGSTTMLTLSGQAGHLQPASTTTAYDPSIYGCGQVLATGMDASSTVTVTEFTNYR